MRLLVRHRLRRTRREGYVDRSELLEADEIRIGRGSDVELHLSDGRVLLHHATLSIRDGVLRVEALDNAEIELDGVPSRAVDLTPGHTVAVGPYDLVCGDPSPDCDAAIGIELTRPMGDAEETLRTRVRTPLLARRRSGWKIGGAIALVLLLIGVGIPLGTFLGPADAPKPVEQNAGTPSNTDFLRLAETMWVTEGLSNVHADLEAGCQACHVTPFAAVAETTCAACHNTLTAHVDPHASFSANVDLSGGCASCHQEHKGPKGITPGVEITEAGCISCHTGDIDPGDGSALARVASIADHPQIELPTAPLSGLIFSHASHLIPQGKRSPDGTRKVLGCVDCHQSANEGQDMTLPSFADGCVSCHTLTFAAEEPDRRLPHGSVTKLRSFVGDFYEAVARGDIQAPEQPEPPRRRRPGQAAEPEPIAPPKPVPAHILAERALSGPAVKGQCATCHALDEGVAAADWSIVPVKAVEDWFSAARFDHDDHKKDAQCSTCHAVTKSEKAEDVSMPSIGTCLDCHGSAADFPDVDSTCVTCHSFHGRTEDAASISAPAWFAEKRRPENEATEELAEILRNARF